MEGGASSSGAQTGSSSTMASRSSKKKLKLTMSEVDRVINLISKDPIGSQVEVDEDDKNVEGTPTPSATDAGDSDSNANTSVVFQAPVNPFQNFLVLTNLFEVCPPVDLAKFRLGSKEWRDLSLKAWRNSATLKLKRDAKSGKLYIVGEGRTTLNQFLKYVEDPGKECEVKPFRRMELRGLIFSTSNRQLERFWSLTGSYLTSLDLNNCKFTDTEEFWKMTYVNCPNLKRLSLWFCSFSSGHSGGEPEYKEPARGKHEHLKCLHISCTDLPVTWLELLSHFESLNSLEVKCTESEYGSLLNAIKVIREQDGNNLPLKNFDVPQSLFINAYDRTSHRNFCLSRELNLPVKLKSVMIKANPDFVDEVNEILELHSGTLERLMLLESYHVHKKRGGRKEWQFPCRVQLGKLRTLSIDNTFMESTQFLKSAPNLERLSITHVRNGGEGPPVQRILDILTDGLAEDTAVLLPKLTKLTYSGCFGGNENLVRLTKLMPNVEELKITLDDEEFGIVCENWKGLKELTVKVDDNYPLTDKGLTGGSIEIEKPDMRWVHKAVQPNITDLKELREFSCDSEELTGISVYNGFLQLPSLETLTLSSKYSRDRDHYGNPSLTPLLFGQEARNDLRERGIKLNFKARSG